MKKGQVTIIGLLYTFMGLLMLFYLQPVITAAIADAMPYSDSITRGLLTLLIPFLYLGIILGYFAYATPQQPR